MGRPRKNKVDVGSMNQTHGALNGPRPIEEILNYGSVYTTDSVEEYNNQIRAMSDVDLHDHAVRVGIVPIDRKELLLRRLEEQFIMAKTKYVRQTVPNKMSKEAQESQRKIMQGAL